jgi:NAD(P)-dependent dehydrogenase (short-subunit alcohol dehydrogenase family)
MHVQGGALPMALLERKSVIITGAASGIGRATALVASREGARLLLADTDEEGLNKTSGLVRFAGGESRWVRADISNAGEVAAIVGLAVEAFGAVDGAFNNAGISSSGGGAGAMKLAEITEVAWNRIIHTNLTGTWLCMRAQIRHMQEVGHGSIVNNVSIAGLTGMAGASAYVASKHGLVGLTKSAAAEYATNNIRINCICPGYIDTAFLPQRLRMTESHANNEVPIGRYGKPEEIAEMAVWLLSDQASYVTGSAMVVDGGVLAR